MSTKPPKKGKSSRKRAKKDTGIANLDKAQNAELQDKTPESGRLIAHLGHQVLLEDSNLCEVQCHLRQQLPDLVVGDEVEFIRSHEGGVVTAKLPRETCFGRYTEKGQFKSIAANVTQIVVVLSAKPAAHLGLLDRYLIIAENVSIPATICFNKIDLLSPNKQKEIKESLSIYESLGYPVCYVSAKTETGLSELGQSLKDQTSVFIGQSGVGKSSLIQLLLPDASLKIGNLSEATGRGKHTTTTSRLYHFKSGGVLIDAPGIRDLPLSHISKIELSHGFKEFRPYQDMCKFNNCTHSHEPGCAIKNQVELGKISAKRLESYQQLLANL